MVTMIAMPGIRIKKQTLDTLNRIKGFVMSQEGRELSHDDLINVLLMQAKFRASDFPDWPIFKMKRWQLDKAIRDYNAKLASELKLRRSHGGGASKHRTPLE